MKISIFFRRSLFVVFLVLSGATVFAGDIVLVPKDPNDPTNPGRDSFEIIPVAATEDNVVLAVYFEEAVGNATITVYNVSEQVVYQTVINTNSQSTATIDISTWTSGDYYITITYGTTYLLGEFTIE